MANYVYVTKSFSSEILMLGHILCVHCPVKSGMPQNTTNNIINLQSPSFNVALQQFICKETELRQLAISATSKSLQKLDNLTLRISSRIKHCHSRQQLQPQTRIVK